MAPIPASELIDRVDSAQENLVLEVADHSLLTIAGLVAKGSIDLTPQFQRRDRWDAAKQAALIESFLLNIPVPPVYLSEDADGVFAVIDGKQRISAIRDFFDDGLLLKGLEKLPEANGYRYSTLPRQVQSKLDKRPVRAVTILRQSDQELKHEVFLRLNRAGEVLNAQEIRNVAYRGPLNDLVYQLSADKFLRTQIKAVPPKAANYRNMLDAEYVLRFLTLRAGWETFAGDFRYAMDKFMEEHQHASPRLIETLRRDFIRSLQACEAIFSKQSFRRPGGRDEALAGMYDAEMVALVKVDDVQITRLSSHRTAVWKQMATLFDDDKFETAVRVGTNTPGRVRFRVKVMQEFLTSF